MCRGLGSFVKDRGAKLFQVMIPPPNEYGTPPYGSWVPPGLRHMRIPIPEDSFNFADSLKIRPR